MRKDDPRSDLQLIDALNDGRLDAFESLYWRYRDWVVALAHRFTANADDALDVLQETFAYFHRKFPGFTLTARLTTFLYPVVKNLSLAARRKRLRATASDHDLLDQLPDPPHPDNAAADLPVILAQLPAIHREVLLMRFVDDMPLDEIAAALQIPLGTVKSRLHNAIATLQEDEHVRSYFLGA